MVVAPLSVPERANFCHYGSSAAVSGGRAPLLPDRSASFRDVKIVLPVGMQFVKKKRITSGCSGGG